MGRTKLRDSAGVEDGDAIEVDDRREAVGDGQHRFVVCLGAEEALRVGCGQRQQQVAAISHRGAVVASVSCSEISDSAKLPRHTVPALLRWCCVGNGNLVYLSIQKPLNCNTSSKISTFSTFL